MFFFFFFQAEDGIRDTSVTGVQTCALPISSELFRACSDMQGYRDRVRQYRRHSPKPNTESGTRYPTGADPPWMAPKTTPVITAATHGPFQERSAVKK